MLFPNLTVDPLHEFELGLLKSVLTHLLRILHLLDPANLSIVNQRYGVHPTISLYASP
jgi:hypothetical protein